MEILEITQELWSRTKELLVPFEGGCTDIYILDVNIENEDQVLKILRGKIPDFTQSWQRGGDNVNSGYIWSVTDEKDILMIFDYDEEQGVFDIDIVFWSDKMFPPGNSETQYIRNLSKLIEIDEEIRSIGGERKTCVLVSEWETDPRERIACGSVGVW